MAIKLKTKLETYSKRVAAWTAHATECCFICQNETFYSLLFLPKRNICVFGLLHAFFRHSVSVLFFLVLVGLRVRRTLSHPFSELTKTRKNTHNAVLCANFIPKHRKVSHIMRIHKARAQTTKRATIHLLKKITVNKMFNGYMKTAVVETTTEKIHLIRF